MGRKARVGSIPTPGTAESTSYEDPIESRFALCTPNCPISAPRHQPLALEAMAIEVLTGILVLITGFYAWVTYR